MPLLRNPDKSKLSKRKNPTSVTFYERMGFMPEAMLNYLGRMGWSMPDEREKFSLQEMVDNFDLKRVSLGGPIFDIEKLSWLNGQWLRDLPVEEFAARVQTWAFNSEYMMKIAPHGAGPCGNLQPGCTAGRVLLRRWREPGCQAVRIEEAFG